MRGEWVPAEYPHRGGRSLTPDLFGGIVKRKTRAVLEAELVALTSAKLAAQSEAYTFRSENAKLINERDQFKASAVHQEVRAKFYENETLALFERVAWLEGVVETALTGERPAADERAATMEREGSLRSYRRNKLGIYK